MTVEKNGSTAPRSRAQALARWEQRFSVGEYLFGESPNAYLASKALLLPKGGTALSIADGEGRNSVWLAQQGLRVDAFDFSPTAVNKARRLAILRGVAVNFNVAEIFDWKWAPRAYDLVAAIFIQFATPAERAQLFPLIISTLKPGGLLVLQGYRVEQIGYGTGGPADPAHLYTEALVRELLENMDLVELVSYDQIIKEGSGHSGVSALMGVVARKR